MPFPYTTGPGGLSLKLLSAPLIQGCQGRDAYPLHVWVWKVIPEASVCPHPFLGAKARMPIPYT